MDYFCIVESLVVLLIMKSVNACIPQEFYDAVKTGFDQLTNQNSGNNYDYGYIISNQMGCGNGPCGFPLQFNSCPQYEQFVACGPTYPPTCSNPNPRNNKMSCTSGCFCNGGRVRDTMSGKCVFPRECPCKYGEVFQLCGCDASCSNPNGRPCKQCHAGCFCPAGLVRNEMGHCVGVRECRNLYAREPLIRNSGPMGCPFMGFKPHMPQICSNPCPPCALRPLRGCDCPMGPMRAGF